MDTPRPQLPDFQFHQNNDSFTLHFQQRLILTHSKDNPCLWIGSGIADIDMFRGNFSIKDKLQEKIALTDAIVSQSPDVTTGWHEILALYSMEIIYGYATPTITRFSVSSE